MRKILRPFPVLAALLVALSLGVTGWAGPGHRKHNWWKTPKTLPFANIRMFFELNETDEDLGVQLQLGADPWKQLKIFDPRGRKILDVDAGGKLKVHGLSDLFFESAEPSFDEVSREEILRRFPAGTYTFIGRTIEGDRLFGKAALTHKIPDGPKILAPADGDEVDPDDVTIKWAPTTTPAPITIESYQVIVTNDEDSRFVYDVRLPADATSLTVPAEFFEEDTEYELEILAVEKSGNQTISIIFFTTE